MDGFYFLLFHSKTAADTLDLHNVLFFPEFGKTFKCEMELRACIIRNHSEEHRDTIQLQ